jgi:hypothetical protein
MSKSSSEKTKIPKGTFHTNESILPWIASIALNVSILIYIANIEGAKCKCIADWRQNFIKYTALLTIGSLFFARIRLTLPPVALIVLFVMQIVNVFALFSYVGDISKKPCSCAIENQKELHSFLKTWRYVPLFFVLCAGSVVLLSYMKSV